MIVPTFFYSKLELLLFYTVRKEWFEWGEVKKYIFCEKIVITRSFFYTCVHRVFC